MGHHVTRDLLARLLSIGCASQDDVESVLEHLFEECPECKEELERLVGAQQRQRSLAEVIQVSLTAGLKLWPRWVRLKATAAVEAEELLGLSPEERRVKVSRALTRFKNPVLVDLLLDESRKRLTSNPFEAYEIADCAHDIALRLSHLHFESTIAFTCLARANAYRANALRAAGHVKRAESMLESAVRLFDEEGSDDPLVEGELMELSAVLRKHQRRFVEAEGYLAMAQGVYEKCLEQRALGRVLVLKAVVLSEAGEPEKAIHTVRNALQIIDQKAEPWLYLCGQHGLTEYLLDVGQFGEAALLIEKNAAIYAAFPDTPTQLRRRWVEARIAAGLGRKQEAEQEFSGVRNGFANAGLGFEAALVGLDLAIIYVVDGRAAAVKKLAEEMLPIFMAQDIHREAAAALLLFQEAAQREAVTANMLAELIAYMRRVRATPEEQVS